MGFLFVSSMAEGQCLLLAEGFDCATTQIIRSLKLIQIQLMVCALVMSLLMGRQETCVLTVKSSSHQIKEE